MTQKIRESLCAAVAVTSLWASVCQATPEVLPGDLTEVGLDKLLDFDLVVTSAGKKAQPLSDVSSAIWVVTNEDIRRSGVTHVAEALRLAPGVEVARIASNQWAVSIRGFNQLFANKLLVLQDGVSIFSPTTNGVYWQTEDLFLEDVDRIEVIRGPGAAVWGANAVNGVINIITKTAKMTQGNVLTVSGGTHDRSAGAFRHGAMLSEDTSYRVHGKFENRAQNRLAGGGDAQDDWGSGAGGFRVDSALTSQDSLVASGDVSYQDESFKAVTPALDPPYHDSSSYSGSSIWKGAKGLVEWQHTMSETSVLTSKISALYKEKSSEFVSFNYETYNFDVQHRVALDARQDVQYGLSYRYFVNEAQDSPAHVVEPSSRQTNLYGAFVQDDISIVADRFRLILGSKFEHNEHTGYEAMPSARVLYTPSSTVSLWSGVSRAVAPPAVFFEDTRIPVAAFPIEGAPLTGVATLVGSRDLVSEELLAYELGARAELDEAVYLDIATYYNQHNNIFGQEAGSPEVIPNYAATGRPAIQIPLNFSNELEGNSYGGEVALRWKPRKDLSVVASYSYLDLNVSLGNGHDTGNQALIEGGSPHHQVGLRLLADLPSAMTLDGALRYVDSLSYGAVNPYMELDLRWAMALSRGIDVFLAGNNLLHGAHNEFEGNLFGSPRTEIERSFSGGFRWMF